jgi:transaldolase
MTKLHELAQLGQAIWFDYIRRSFTRSGKLQKLVDQGLRGVTSNPTIFQKAIAGSDDYDHEMQALIRAGKSVDEIYETLAIRDIQEATEVLRPVYNTTNGADGYVSLEVSPRLAHDTDRTIVEARRLFAAVDRPNVMIKVPATPEGLPAITTLIGEGININVTLIFSIPHYEAVVEAYLKGLEKRAQSGGDLSTVASVASIFVSRVDTAVDKKLAELGSTDLQGKIAVAHSKLAYARFRELHRSARWERLATAGANIQRPLWGSTGTKNPAYSDVLYVESLIGPHTVNTAPPHTLDAFLDHGMVAETIETGLDDAKAALDQLAGLGIDLNQIMQDLQDAGVKSFADSFESLMKTIKEKREALLSKA